MQVSPQPGWLESYIINSWQRFMDKRWSHF